MKQEIAKMLLHVIPGLQSTPFDINDNGQIFVSKRLFRTEPYESLLGVIDPIKSMNQTISWFKEYFGPIASLCDSEGKSYIYPIYSPEKGKMQICLNMDIFRQFDDENKMSELKAWIKELHVFWLERAKPYSKNETGGYTSSYGLHQYTAEARAKECLEILEKLNNKSQKLTSAYSFFSIMSKQNIVFFAATTIGVISTMALISHARKK